MFTTHEHIDIEYNSWNKIWTVLTKTRGGSSEQWIPAVLRNLSPVSPRFLSLPRINVIGGIRKVGGTGQQGDLDGRGIIDQLADLQHPKVGAEHKQENFQEINSFVQTVLGSPDTFVEIPSDKNEVIVNLEGKRLPLEKLGTGLHELILIASYCTIHQEQVICIEEPEIHLHPVLQRKLIRYLGESTRNQYFVATHSAHLIDSCEPSDTAVFHIRLREGQSEVTTAATSAELFAVCQDLGYHASDLLQSNCVVWVEGPSDRLYLRWWIDGMAPELREGIHYSLMFYGGKLLSHLSTLDPEDERIEELISLRRINRNMCIVMDSDKDSRGKKTKPAVRRLHDEFSRDAGMAWVTDGREIENYFTDSDMEEALKAVHEDVRGLAGSGRYAQLWKFKTSSGKLREGDKVRIARWISSNKEVNLSVPNLKNRLVQLVGFIRSSNDLPLQ